MPPDTFETGTSGLSGLSVPWVRGIGPSPKRGISGPDRRPPGGSSYAGGVLHLRRPVGAIVGRATELRRLAAELERTRLVSLVGPGGVGKTALAAELAHEVEPDLDRLVTVELLDADQADDPRRLLSTAVLGEHSATVGSIAAGLDAERTLVIIDNGEHLIDDVAELVADLIDRTAQVTVLVTSRRPLDLGQETVWTVEPLAAPDASTLPEELERLPAVQLFLERAYRAAPAFRLTPDNRPLVAEICRAADGVPLVVELAAALVRTTTLDAIVEAMGGSSSALASNRRDLPRHQRSIEASLDWSRRFLDDADRELLDRLSVFVGGFPAEAALAIDRAATPAALTRLCDHSLLTFDPTSGRYRLIEIVRVDGAGRLGEDEEAEVAEAHRRWCGTVVEALEAARYAADPDNRFPAFELELPNLAAAFRRCHQRGEHHHARAILGPIALWWVHYLPPDDPNQWIELFHSDDTPTLWRANVTSALSYLSSHQGDHERALALATEAGDLHRQADDPVGEALILSAAGNALAELGRRPEAAERYRRGLETAVAAEDPYAEMTLRTILARFEPDAPEADSHLERAAELGQGGFGAIESIIWAEQGLRALRRGDLALAGALTEQALDRARHTSYPEAVANALCGRADVAAAAAQPDLATERYREALRLGRRMAHQGLIDRATTGLNGLNGPGGPGRATAPPTTEGPSPTPSPAESLSDRELAVARLLRGDLTQREIADELYIAPSTVKTHITSIYRKLGVAKRSHAITRAAELGLFDR